jgi:hypothetical protein
VTKNYYETNSKWAWNQFKLCKLEKRDIHLCLSLSLHTLYIYFACDPFEYTRILTILFKAASMNQPIYDA